MFCMALALDLRSLMLVGGLAVHISMICWNVGSDRMPRIINFIVVFSFLMAG